MAAPLGNTPSSARSTPVMLGDCGSTTGLRRLLETINWFAERKTLTEIDSHWSFCGMVAAIFGTEWIASTFKFKRSYGAFIQIRFATDTDSVPVVDTSCLCRRRSFARSG